MTIQPATRSPLATPTLVVGIAAAVLALLGVLPVVGLLAAPLAFMAAIAAIIIGHIALARASGGSAKIGLVFGYVGLALTVGMLILRFV